MKRFIKFIVLIISVGLIIGCGNNKTKEDDLTTDLSKDIELSEEGASAVCTTESTYNTNSKSVTASKFVIYADANDIVTRVEIVELASSNDIETLRSVRDVLEEKYNIASQYGGYTYDIQLSGKRLTVRVTIDHTKLDLEKMATVHEELKIYLNKDNKYTLSSIISMYEAVGVENCIRK